MGYRDSDDSGFSRHGMGRDHDEGRYSEQRAHRGSLERDEPRGGAYGAEFDDRSDRSGSYGPYPQYGPARNDYRAEGDYSVRADRSRFAPGVDRFQYGGGYRNDGRDMYASHPQRFDNDYRDGYPSQEQGRSARGGRAGYYDGGGGASASGYLGYPQDGQQRFQGQQGAQGHHDPDYQQWRQEQMRLLDEDYQSWRQERYQKFADDFNTWRSSRTQPSSSGKGQSGATTGSSGTTTGSAAQSGGSSSKSKDAS